MTTVLLCGGENGGQMRQALVRALNQYGGVQRFAKEQLEGNHEPRFCLYECTKIPAVSHTAGVLILKNSYEEQEGPLQLSGLVPVLEQHNSRALHSLQGQNCNQLRYVCKRYPEHCQPRLQPRGG